MDDGSVRRVRRGDGTRFRAGDRVRMAGSSQVELLAQ
jgi:hypothetical protein